MIILENTKYEKYVYGMKAKTLRYLIVLSVFYSISFSQQIEPGKFVSVLKYDHFTGETIYSRDYREEITITDSLHFKYRYVDDITDERGFGFYKQGKKFLNLDFTDITIDYDTLNYFIMDSSISEKDSIKLKFKIRDKEHVLQGARIEYIGNINKIAAGSDNNGNTTIWVSLNNLPGYVRVTYVGYDHVFITLTGPYNKVIQVNMDTPYKLIPKGKALTYSIKEVDIDGFYAKGGTFSEWTFFKREE